MKRQKRRSVATPPPPPRSALASSALKTARIVGIFFVFTSLTGFLIVGAGVYLVREYVAYGTESVVITPETTPKTFPVGVNPKNKEISENPDVENFFETYIESEPLARRSHTQWFGAIMSRVAELPFLQQIASPTGRILVIRSGERKEEIARSFGSVLGWSTAERELFLERIIASEPFAVDGKFAPGTYFVERKAKPEAVADLVLGKFTSEVLERYPNDLSEIVSLHDTLTIASLLEREAYDFEDMRMIAGIIWNRLFINMPLQIDATLQYATGSKHPKTWWPPVVPDDKYVTSPFNTYAHKGLPPHPIANPSLDAILAALNPKETSCLYYFHDRKGAFYCSETYEGHVSALTRVYGRGK